MTRGIRTYFRWLAISLVALGIFFAAFAFRPTPIAGFDGGSLAASVNGGGPFSGAYKPCRRHEEEWVCVVATNGGSYSTSYNVSDPDWWGCWAAARKSPVSGEPPRDSLHGCITLLDHF